MNSIVLIAHDIRSCHNVGSLLRTADGFGVECVYLTGYTPYPRHRGDSRLPHLADKITRQIQKTALGAESSVIWQQRDQLTELLQQLREDGYKLIGLEQAPSAINLYAYEAGERVALLLGREVEGIEPNYLQMMDDIVEIPMFGQKESFNVTQAAAIGLFQLRRAG